MRIIVICEKHGTDISGWPDLKRSFGLAIAFDVDLSEMYCRDCNAGKDDHLNSGQHLRVAILQ
jgi:hypothetical protein